MELGKAIGEFTLKVTSTMFSESQQEGTRINLDGTMSKGGNVVGTLTLRSDGPIAYDGGRVDWLGATTEANGEIAATTGRGYFYKTGPGEYRLRLLTQMPTGDCAVVEGRLTRGHYNGVVFAW